ncbi:MAG: glycosyl hydrolase 115 family protein [Prevotellaceae bacterium]|nr:glycosyl hydrolase 115 family protein [Prevotellaceae bacterium]
MKRLALYIVVLWMGCSVAVAARRFCIERGERVGVAMPAAVEPVATTALEMFAADVERVLDGRVERASADAARLVVSIDAAALQHRKEAFRIEVGGDGRLLLTASDSHGIAYGLLEVSRLMGVSPWEWWADCTPRPLQRFTLKAGWTTTQAPAVEFRGIFINDEDWGLTPWATAQDSVSSVPVNDILRSDRQVHSGIVGPKVSERIFELLLRLRANTYWPPMHECTLPFFLTEGNRAVAERYGIYIGSSHCEPMACNVNGEWRHRGEGDYDYVNNAAAVDRFWQQRVAEVAGQPIIYTLGMRGVHDGAMKGARTIAEQREVLQRVFRAQRTMLATFVDADTTCVPQVFIPYKEVLDIYHAGLQVPDDVCLMWCDDNYGYLTHVPTDAERRRSGGNGLYYHTSYWGRPHDYLWIGTCAPALQWQQLQTAYEQGIRRMWVLNVGDIKPAEYSIELFMDMAWTGVRSDGGASWQSHLEAFLSREFGAALARRLLPVLTSAAHLSFVRKPEFMGGTRTEEADRTYWNMIHDIPFTQEEIRGRLATYDRLAAMVDRLETDVPLARRDAYFQLVKYPVQAAAEMNRKFLSAQLARHAGAQSSSAAALWTESRRAFDRIDSLTRIYNEGIANGGKWRGLMDSRPRRLPVFNLLTPDTPQDTAAVPSSPLLRLTLEKAVARHDDGSRATTGLRRWNGLGHSRKAVEIPVATSASCPFRLPTANADSVEVEVRLLPVHPLQGNRLRFRVAVDGGDGVECDIATHGRSEEWKQNVLRNQAVRRVRLPLRKTKNHRLIIRAIDPGIIVDEVLIVHIV